MAFFSFNGVTKDYVRVLRGLERPAWAPIEHEILEIPGRPGGLISGKKIKVRQINIPVRVYTKGFESLQKAKEDLAAWLITDEPKELIFSDEPDRVYYAQVTGELNLDELVEWGEGVISFICPDPYKYGPLRTQTIAVPPASFSRNSVAYLSDGTQVSANQPRFEQGGVLVEEGTVNLLQNPSFETDSNGDGVADSWTKKGTGTFSIDSTTKRTGGKSQKYVGTTGQDGVIWQDVACSEGQIFTVSAYLKIDSLGLNGKVDLAIEFFNSTGGTIGRHVKSIQSTNTSFQRYTQTATAPTGAVKVRAVVHPYEATIYIDDIQLEQKPYATSFVDGTRQPETLTLPTDGILNGLQSWTIEGWILFKSVYWSPLLKNIDHSIFWHMGTTGDGFGLEYEIHMAREANSNKIGFYTPSTGARYSNFVANNEQWYHFAFVYDNGRYKIYVNGQKVIDVLGGQIDYKQIGNLIWLNVTALNRRYVNGVFGKHRISCIARSDAEILDAYQNGFTVDEYTTAYLPFDGDLNVQAPTIVTNEGTAETYPVFTAYVKQPITFLDIISPDSYMRVGQPYATDQTPVDGDVRVLNDNMSTLTGWGSASAIDGGVIQGSFHVVSETFQVKDYGPTYNGWAGPALKKSVPSPIQDFQVKALIDITSSANGVGRIEIYGLDTANNFVFRMGIGDFSAKSKDVKAYWELGPSTDTIFTTYGKKKGMLNDYYGILVIQRKGNRWTFSTARRTSAAPVANYVDYVQSTFVDTKSKYTGQLAQIQIHIGTHLGYGPISHMSINHIEVFELRDTATDQIPYIAYPDDVLQFDHKNAVIYRNGEPIMWAKDFGASFFALKPGATELAANPSDAAVVTIDYRPRYK